MATIRESILKNSIAQAQARYDHLRQMDNAPICILDATEKRISELQQGKLDVAHIDEFGALEYTSFEVKTGRGGKTFVSFTTVEGIINYFPQGRFGPFISKQKEK